MHDKDRIQVYKKNPYYWQYKGKPTMLIGGSVEDNLFQIPCLREHLDLLKSVGGNYIRCTMSSRDEGNVWPHKKINGKYDLNQWNEEYWNRFESLLQLTNERDIIVQIEIWDPFDYHQKPWESNSFNPKNNINLTTENTELFENEPRGPEYDHNPFFHTTPSENNEQNLLQYQHRFVDKILSHTFKYNHVLYCINNESYTSPAWGQYWARYIIEKAREAEKDVEVTEMFWPIELSHPKHKTIINNPSLFSFWEVSQNNAQVGEEHWKKGQKARSALIPTRPMNNVKIYNNHPVDPCEGIERFWRNIIGGMASCRFHRPTLGMGLNELAQANIKSARMFLDKYDIFSSSPGNELLLNRKENSAFLTSQPGKAYAIYFTNGDKVDLDLRQVEGTFHGQWLDIVGSQWRNDEYFEGGRIITLLPPSANHWLIVINKT